MLLNKSGNGIFKWSDASRKRKTYCHDQSSSVLKTKLGKWINQGHSREWPCYYDPTTKIVTIRNDYDEENMDHEQWDRFHVDSRGTQDRHQLVGEYIHTNNRNFEYGQPTFITQQQDESWTCWVHHDPTTRLDTRKNPKEQIFKEYLQTIPQWERELLDDCECVDGSDGESLANYIRDLKKGSNLIGASDGGLRKIKREYGVHGWAIAIYDSHTIWRGKGQAQGTPNASYRTEGIGIIAVRRMIYHTMIFWKVAPSSLEEPVFLHYSDSESFIKKQRTLHAYGDTWYPAVHTWPHADVLLQLREAEADIWLIQCKLSFVPSHQDKNTPVEKLSPEAQLNQQCDDLCNEKLEELEKKNKRQATTLLPAGRVYLEHKGSISNRKQQQTLKNALPGDELKAYYMVKHGWTATVYHHIIWSDYGRARKRTENIARYVTKLGCNWLPTNDRMKLTDGISDACKVCGEEEDNDHIFECNGQVKWRKKFYLRLYRHLVKTDTESYLIALIMQGLPWHYEDHASDPKVAIGDEKQHSIGWKHMFRGWIDKSWIPLSGFIAFDCARKKNYFRRRRKKKQLRITNRCTWS